ncbi:hypothetical protein AUR04nite_01790 [Glutamicibacter uratoxydans]|uniref:AbiEi antitoxin C-terminal domain-containing protein n=1 Tax=Glutamicibacter uratoxydans TaxID=43667 RepID=A0A4Y4DJ42_GLUUR|nr:hypothetical protein AUR04nite_01790 [Glutamicibacter uratoxydans]
MDTIHTQAAGRRAAALRIPEDLLIAGEMFSRNELGAMAGRGLVREAMGNCFVPAFFSYDAAVRARIAAFVSGRQLQRQDVICRETAAWVHGLLPFTLALCIASPGYRRPYRPGNGLQVSFTQLQLSKDEVVTRHRVKVTSELRTVCDCAAFDPLPTASGVLSEVVRRRDPELQLGMIAQALEAYPPQPEVSRALRLVGSFSQQAADEHYPRAA